MKAIEILEKNPESAKLVVEWFFNKMLESLNSGSIDEEFRNFMREQALDNEKIAVMIDANPRMLLDVFDENDVFIFIHYMDVKDKVEFFHSFRNIDTNPVKLFKTRKEAELFAIETAFEILEAKLAPPVIEEETPKEETDETDNK